MTSDQSPRSVRRFRAAWLLGWAAAAAVLPGCQLPVGSLPDASGGPLGPAQARTVSYQGWRHSGQLSNGLVRATIVPQVGGRTLEYALGGCNFLFVGEGELGKTHENGAEARYRHFGGQFAQLHPEEKWASLRSSYPPTLFMGRYEMRLLPPEAGKAAVELTSAPDPATGTRLVRRVELFPGSTRLRITDTLTNVRTVAQEWGIQAMLQLKGVPTPSGVLRPDDRPDGATALYVPLNPKSRFKGGVQSVGGAPPGRGGAETWSTAELPGLLTLHYRREFGKAVVDPSLPWVAFVDSRSAQAFVQSCSVPEKAILSAAGGIAPYPFVEVQCLGKVARLAPGESTSVVQDWYAARCPGPVVDVTPAGVVASPLSLLSGQGKTWVAGTFGVFCVGTAAVVFQGADGAELGRLDCGPVTPLAPFRLNAAADVPPQTAQVTLEIRGADGKPAGHLGRIALKPR